MQDVQELLAKARALGEALAAHPVVRAYHTAQQTARKDASAQELMRQYQAHLEHVRQLEAAQKPVEVADKHKLRDLEGQMAGHAALKSLMRCQTDYVTLMNQVNRAMDEPLAALVQPETSA